MDDSVVNESMALHLTFDGNYDDISGNENNGSTSNVNLTTDRFGNENSAASFIGLSDITIPMSQSLRIENNMTMSFWMLPTEPENDDCCFTILKAQNSQDWNSQDYKVELHQSDIANSKMWNLFTSPGGNDANNGEPGYMYDNEWVMVTVIIEQRLTNDSIGDPTGWSDFRYYYNGVLAYDTERNGASSSFNSDQLVIGANNRNNNWENIQVN